MKSRAFTKTGIGLILLVIAIGVVWLFHVWAISSHKIRNVLLISIDTCRADRLSCYGYRVKTTPNIDAIADEAVLFKNVISPVPQTLPAHCSMLTGTIPPYHQVHDNLNEVLGESHITLAEILKENGFTTGAIISSIVLDVRYGLGQGFDTYNYEFEEPIKTTRFTERSGGEASKVAIEWLEGHKEDDKFFLFLHYYDPHHRYEPPEPFATRFRGHPYDGEIAYTDYCIAQVIDKLKELKLYDSTLLIITGDHGEMLGEHGESAHCYFIYQGAIKVPLIFKLPGSAKPRRIKDIVGLVDIAPTVCSLLGIEMPSDVQGTDLSDYIKGHQPKARDRYIYCESLVPTKYGANTLLGVVNQQWKYIQTTRSELYDVVKDPAESENLISEQPQRARIMQDQLRLILEEGVWTETSDDSIRLDKQAIEELRSLGYVGSNIEVDFSFNADKDDPKDLIGLYTKFCLAMTLAFKKEYEQAEKIFREIIDERPGLVMAYQEYSNFLISRNKCTEAIGYLERALELEGEEAETYMKLGYCYRSLEKFDEASKYYLKALEIDSEASRAYAGLGHCYESLNKLDEAIEYFGRALQINPELSEAHTGLGDCFRTLERFDEATKHYAKALEFAPEFARAHFGLGKIFYLRNQLDLAIKHLRESLKTEPEFLKARSNLANALYKRGDIKDALEEAYLILEAKPDMEYYLNFVAWIRATSASEELRNPEEAVRLATKACELASYENVEIINTLAAAFASAGRFDDAVQITEEAIKLAPSNGNRELAEKTQKRLQLYKRNLPYFDLTLSRKKDPSDATKISN